MIWECQYYINVNGNCTRLEKFCQPLQKGCVLERKIEFINSEENKKQEDGKYKNEYQGDSRR